MKTVFAKIIWNLIYMHYAVEARKTEYFKGAGNEKFPMVFAHVLLNRGESLMDLPPVEPREDFIDVDLQSWNPSILEKLTKEGIQDQYENGKWLRKRYESLLHERYWKPDIYVQSADVDSSITSAMTVMAGMFPPSDNQDMWLPYLNWQPTPVHVVAELEDNKLLLRMKCSAEVELETMNKKSLPDFAKLRRKIDSVLNLLTFSVGYRVKDKHIPTIINALKTQEKYNLTSPFWAQMVYPNPISGVQKKIFSSPILNEKNKKFKSGALLNEMVSHIDAKINGELKPDRTVWMYSGGDSYLSYLISTLQVNLTRPPTFSDMFLIELRHDPSYPGLYYIMLLYKGKDDKEPVNLKMKKCSILCPLNEFKNIIQSYIITDWKKDCKNLSLKNENNLDASYVLILLLVGLFILR